MEKKKVSETVPVQAIIPRSLYVELVKRCAQDDLSIKEVIQSLIEDFVKHDKFLCREWQMSDEQYKKALSAYEAYLNIRDEVEKVSIRKSEQK